MMGRIYAAAILLLLFFQGVRAQEFQYYRQAGGDIIASGYADRANAIVVDPNGDVVIVGEGIGTPGSGLRFGGLVTFDIGTYIAKFNSAGTALWVKSQHNSNTMVGAITEALTSDKDHNYIVTGGFKNSLVLGFGEPNATTLTATGNAIFVAKYATDGNLLWARSAAVSGLEDSRGTAVKTDESGNVYIAGWLGGPTVFGQAGATASLPGNSTFVAKYSPTGALLSTISVTLNFAGSASIALDKNGNLYVGATNGLNILSKFSPTGTQLWSKTPILSPGKIALDGSDNILVTGLFSSTISYGTGATAGTLVAKGLADMYLAKYNTNGDILWARGGGSTGNDVGNGVAIDRSNNIVVTGYMEGNATFGSGTSTKNLTGSGSTDVFLVKYSTAGDLLWATSAGGSGGEEGKDVAVDADANNYVAGFSNSSNMIFGKGEPNQATFSTTGWNDIFFAKFKSSEFVPPPSGLVTAIEEIFDRDFTAYPNPAHAYVQMSISSAQAGQGIVSIRDLAGREIMSVGIQLERDKNETIIELPAIAAGVYIVELREANKKRFAKIFIN